MGRRAFIHPHGVRALPHPHMKMDLGAYRDLYPYVMSPSDLRLCHTCVSWYLCSNRQREYFERLCTRQS